MSEPRKVRVGEPVRADHINALVDAVLEARLQKGVGYGLKRGPGGTTLQIFGSRMTPMGEVAGPGGVAPFQVDLRVTAGGYEAYVNSGDLRKSLQPSDKQSITGLQAWFTTVTNDLIFLQGTVSGYTISACEVNSIGDGGSFTATTGAWNTNAYVTKTAGTTGPQDAFRYLIAQVVTAGTTPESLRVVQILDEHLLSRNTCIDGRPAIYPFPDSAAYVS
jgi:hypothetical protein